MFKKLSPKSKLMLIFSIMMIVYAIIRQLILVSLFPQFGISLILQIAGAFIAIYITMYISISKIVENPINKLSYTIEQLIDGNTSVKYDISGSNDIFDYLGRKINQYTFVLDNIVSNVTESILSLSNASEELSSTSEVFAKNSQEHAASIEEISSSMEEVSAGGETIYNNIKDLDDRIKYVTQLIGESMNIVTDAGQNMGEAIVIKEDLDEMMSHVVNEIEKSKESITMSQKSLAETLEIGKVVREISDKINLLSLNAQIEAARAGEHGKGFAVVGNEISKLADNTKTNTDSIVKNINLLNQYINESNEKFIDILQAINNIIPKIKRFGEVVMHVGNLAQEDFKKLGIIKDNSLSITDNSGNIVLSIKEQSDALEEVNKVVNDISNNIQTYASGSEELIGSAVELSNMSSHISDKLKFFKLKQGA